MTYDEDYTIEVTYTAFGYDDAGETTFEMEIPQGVFEQLEQAEDDGEYLDAEYISQNMKRLHRKILDAIRENMEEVGMDPNDGMKEKRLPWGYTRRYFDPMSSHLGMLHTSDDGDIEYTITI